MAERKDFVKVGGDENYSRAMLTVINKGMVNISCRADVEPARRICCNDDLRFGGKLAGNDDALLIAAGERGYQFSWRRSADTKSVDLLSRELPYTIGSQEETRRES